MTGTATPWDAEVAPYAVALGAVARSCRKSARRHIGVGLPELHVTLRQVPPGGERVATDYASTVVVEAAAASQFQPSTPWRWIYGVAHEVGHIVVARLLGPGRIPPVVWDEALAHFVATRMFLPDVWHDHGARLWPYPYPDYVTVEGTLPTGPAGHFGGYVPSLRAFDARLAVLAGNLGAPHVLTALGALRGTDMRTDRFGPALERQCG